MESDLKGQFWVRLMRAVVFLSQLASGYRSGWFVIYCTLSKPFPGGKNFTGPKAGQRALAVGMIHVPSEVLIIRQSKQWTGSFPE
jgi:hypothetical protein